MPRVTKKMLIKDNKRLEGGINTLIRHIYEIVVNDNKMTKMAWEIKFSNEEIERMNFAGELERQTTFCGFESLIDETKKP